MLNTTLLVLTFAYFAVFDKVREICTGETCYFGKFCHFWAILGCLQHFVGESTKIYVHEMLSFLTPRKQVPVKINTNKVAKTGV